jgi:mannose-1-phosphate guanylyltransferase
MRTKGASGHRFLDRIVEVPPDSVQPWAIVLAGGAGARLRQLTLMLSGDDRPKQYARVVGRRSLLRQTLDRLALAISAERTVAVVTQTHARYIAEEFGIAPTPRQIVQPTDRGTAAAILLAAQWVSWRDPDGVLVVFPSDHLILGELMFMTHVVSIAGFVDRHPERILIIGASPTAPETEYGWIEPREPIERIDGTLVSSVKRFLEKPPATQARACLAQGWLWNTFIMAAKAATLVDVGWQMLPELSERLSRIEPAVDSEYEPWAIDEAYAGLEPTNFSRDVLERCSSTLAVSRLPAGVTWLDLGSPDRVVRGLNEAGLTPPWLTMLKPILKLRAAVPSWRSALSLASAEDVSP